MDCNDYKTYEEMPAAEKAILIDWIEEHLTPFRAMRFDMTYSSYNYKHFFEKSENGFYVTNGQFKGAMLSLGFIPHCNSAMNWHFKIKRKAVTLLSK